MKKQRRSYAAGFLTALLLTGLIGTAGAAVGRRTVEVDYNNIKVSLDGAQVALVDANGSPVEPFAIDGTTYLPIRAVSSALGLEVGWDAATSTAVLTTPEEEREVYITRTGSKYHEDPACGGGSYWPVPQSSAQGLGLEPCGKCVGSTTSSSQEEYQAYTVVNNNIPFFTQADREGGMFETYSELDSLGRCGVAFANICPELMPTEDRGEIGSVQPTGWHTVRYDDLIDGMYLYNRCHLIGYQLAGENANEKNLITGTRFLNMEGMLPFENLVADYVEETGNHVLYRVTPDFQGEELVARGVQMEAYSIEDEGEGVCFNIYAYNIQPGIEIDYLTGESRRVA